MGRYLDGEQHLINPPFFDLDPFGLVVLLFESLNIVYFSGTAQNVGRHLPRVELTERIYGIGRDAPIVIYERLATISLDDVGNTPDPVRGINDAVRRRIATFQVEVTLLAESHGCRAIPGTVTPSSISAALSSMLAQRLETIEQRVLTLERCAAHQCAEIKTLEKTISPIIEGS